MNNLSLKGFTEYPWSNSRSVKEELSPRYVIVKFRNIKTENSESFHRVRVDDLQTSQVDIRFLNSNTRYKQQSSSISKILKGKNFLN